MKERGVFFFFKIELHVSDTEENAWLYGLKCETAGNVFVATRIYPDHGSTGPGKSYLPLPTPNSQSSNVYFSGPAFSILNVTAGDKVFRRRLHTRGCNAYIPPIKLVEPTL